MSALLSVSASQAQTTQQSSVTQQSTSIQDNAQRAAQQQQASQVDVNQFVQGNGTALDGAQLTGQNEVLFSNIKPFGANLFDSGIESSRTSGVNPQYLIAPGDKVSVQLWGAVTFAQVLTVDTQGNIFIPEVGPVNVANSPAGSLNQTVTQKIRSVYPRNVNIYVNLLTSTPVGVYVSGPVARPGQYAGLSSDSILHYLKRAGGIDPQRGSYRTISVLRNNVIVKQYDLYDFLLDGTLDAFSFRDSDVVLVSKQGATITVEGTAKNTFRFELTSENEQGSTLIDFASPLAESSHVAITGTRDDGPISVYIPLSDFLAFTVEDGDTLLFNDDIRPQVLSISLSGSYLGPSFYAVNKNTRLLDFLSHIRVDTNESDVDSIFIKRQSVALRQKELLDESLQRLERSVFTAPASSSGEAQIRAQEAELVSQFIARAKTVIPLGKVVVSVNGKLSDIQLEDGDEIVIPEKTDLIQLGGEVLIPQAIVYNKEFSIKDYIDSAGGFSERANTKRLVIIHASGLTSFTKSSNSSYWFNSDDKVQLVPGDQILVLPEVDRKILQSIKDITQIIFQIAVAANVALD